MKDGRPSASAQTVAACRAHLTWLGAVDDPLAASMLSSRSALTARALRYWPLRGLGRSSTMTFMAARTRFYDEAVTRGLDGGATQVVIVAAGYDSRAWRMARPGVRFFEVDHPATQEEKRRRAPADGPTYVPADLCTDRLVDVLPVAGFDRQKRSVFLVEGVTMYLPEVVVVDVFTQLAELAAMGSTLASNFTVRGGGSASPISAAFAHATRLTWQFRGEPTYGWVQPDALDDVLNRSGWEVDDTIPAPELAQRYARGTGLRLEGLNRGAICVAAVRK